MAKKKKKEKKKKHQEKKKKPQEKEEKVDQIPEYSLDSASDFLSLLLIKEFRKILKIEFN